MTTFVLAWMSWRYVETPFRHAAAVSKKRIFAVSGAGMLVFFAVGAIVCAANGFDGRVKGELSQELVEVSTQRLGNYECWGMTDQTKRENCTLGSTNNGVETDFALVGDSHVSTLYSLLDAHGIDSNKYGLDITMGSCPVFLQSYPSGTQNPVQCRSLQLYFSELMSKGTLPQNLIVGGAWIQWFELEDSRGGTGRAEDVTNSI